MLKKSITYTNPFTEQEVTEDHYFHISKADLVEMEMEEHGTTYQAKDGRSLTGMQAKLQQIIDSEDGKAIMTELKDMVRRSYGKKVGDRFVKSTEVWEEFSGSDAFSQLLYELCTNAEAAAQFMTGIVPSNLEQEAAKIAAAQAQANGSATPAPEGRSAEDLTPEEVDEVQTLQRDNLPQNERVLTKAEIEEMDSDELKSGLATGRYKLS